MFEPYLYIYTDQGTSVLHFLITGSPEVHYIYACYCYSMVASLKRFMAVNKPSKKAKPKDKAVYVAINP